MDPVTMQAKGMFLATGALYALRRTGQDIETRPAWYASLFGQAPGLEQEIADFSHAWRTRNSHVAMASLMARRPARAGPDPVAFLRVVGRDVREHPESWAHDIEAFPDLGRDLARLARTLAKSVAGLPADAARAT